MEKTKYEGRNDSVITRNVTNPLNDKDYQIGSRLSKSKTPQSPARFGPQILKDCPS